MKHNSRLLAGAACAAALLIPACASGGYGGPGYGSPDREPVLLHEGENFSGATLPVNGPLPDLAPLRFNDTVSSITINYGSWEVCEDANFRGRCEVFSRSEPSLRPMRLNDNISSIRPIGDYGYAPGPGGSGYGSLVLFSSPGMRGDALPVERDEPSLGRVGFNDRAQSVDVRSGVWQICVDGDYRGRCETIDRPVSDLRDIGLSGNVSSVRRVADDPYRRGY